MSQHRVTGAATESQRTERRGKVYEKHCRGTLTLLLSSISVVCFDISQNLVFFAFDY